MSNTFLHRILATDNGSAALALRMPVGIIFAAHGAQKLFGWFGGYGLEGTGQYMESIGLTPGVWMAGAAGAAEFFGGLLLIAGLLTRSAALMLAVTMVVAIVTAHLSNGLFMSNNGYEFALTMLAASVSLLVSGAGRLSVDAWLGERLGTQPWGAATLSVSQ